ncbi:MAG: type II/IV secretion system protein [Sedimentisphaerales bacterium]|nr:type II/IV secretion system protein [Sedimentisphaerales bacterium]
MAISHYGNKSCDTKTTGNDVVVLVDELLKEATRVGASDIHFEPGGNELSVKFRLDGVLNTVETLPRAISDNVIARLKVLGNLLTYRNDIPQEGRIETNNGSPDVVDRRLSVFPTIYGQRAVVRIFYQNTELTDLEQLGLADQILSTLKHIARANQGILLVTGPAGSGKSTTLAAILRYIQKQFPGKSIVTLEDPVELRLDGVTQVQITPFGPMTFPTALRSLLRQDPEVLMIGEIRDAETAKIAIEAGLTGHLLMSTMHSGRPSAAILRLLEMGIEPYQITSSVSAVLNQRLVRRLCENCKKDNNGDFEAVGCEKCLGTGFKGRMLIAEIMQLDGPLRKAVLARSDCDGLEKMLDEQGHKHILEDGLRFVRQGITTQAELDKVCGSANT